MVFIVWFVLSICVGVLAGNRGRSAIGWFLLACIVSPIISFIILLVIKNIKEEEEQMLYQQRARARWQEEKDDEERRHQQILQAILMRSNEGADLNNGVPRITKECQFCGGEIVKEAIICKYCDNILK
ncbi:MULTISPECIES: hypothetical protein [Pectobacterium]|nr:hypothetical protein [Pectobacterium sp. IFB5596]MCE9733411.1 hypothetical protein [Pectobacterium sp. IFB5596]